MSPTVFRVLFFVATCVATFGFFMELKAGGGGFAHKDKIVHILVFFTLTWLYCKGFSCTLIKVIFIAATYGAAIEILQGEFFGREASFADWVADMLGALGAFYLVKRFQQSTNPALTPEPKQD